MDLVHSYGCPSPSPRRRPCVTGTFDPVDHFDETTYIYQLRNPPPPSLARLCIDRMNISRRLPPITPYLNNSTSATLSLFFFFFMSRMGRSHTPCRLHIQRLWFLFVLSGHRVTLYPFRVSLLVIHFTVRFALVGVSTIHVFLYRRPLLFLLRPLLCRSRSSLYWLYCHPS